MTVSRNTDSYHLKLVSAVFTNYIQNINQSIIYKMVTHSRPAYEKVARNDDNCHCEERSDVAIYLILTLFASIAKVPGIK